MSRGVEAVGGWRMGDVLSLPYYSDHAGGIELCGVRISYCLLCQQVLSLLL